MLGVLLMLQVAGSDLPQPPPFVPPKTQTARCVGVDSLDRRQTLTLESRWLPDEHRAAVFVRDDSSGLLKDGEWLENQNGIYRDGDRKQGIVLDWDDTSFSKRVGDQYARNRYPTREHSIRVDPVCVSRAYSDREQAAMRYPIKGTILLAGHCSLFVEGERRNFDNAPRSGPVP